ncbi:MAG: acetate--CoA ligase family protein [Candidatus Micrarchaeia archaeon]|jgi:acyl-CoA synthetase (NDP forming)
MGMIEDFQLMEKYNFKLIPYGVAKSKDEAAAIANKIGYPIVLKVVSPEITHKTDVGGVKVNIKNGEMLKLAYDDIASCAKGKKLDGILVQKMARKGVELIVGGKKDEQFGHMIVLGLGGIYVEIFRDITARICPIEEEDIMEMVAELKAHPLITGARGRKPIHLKSLTKLLLDVCKFLKTEDIKEMDLNPVIFDENGCDIVDVRFSR